MFIIFFWKCSYFFLKMFIILFFQNVCSSKKYKRNWHCSFPTEGRRKKCFLMGSAARTAFFVAAITFSLFPHTPSVSQKIPPYIRNLKIVRICFTYIKNGWQCRAYLVGVCYEQRIVCSSQLRRVAPCFGRGADLFASRRVISVEHRGHDQQTYCPSTSLPKAKRPK